MTAPSQDRQAAIRQALQSLGRARGPGAEATRQEHVNLVQSIRRPADVALHVEPKDDNHWRVTVCTADSLGALSVVAGLFTAYRLDIGRGEICTLHLPNPQPERPRIVRGRGGGSRLRRPEPHPPRDLLFDIFEVQALNKAGPAVWQRFEDELTALVRLLVAGQTEEARAALVDRVSSVFEALGGEALALLPIAITATNEPGSAYTRLTVRSADTPGFLFAFTNALAGFTTNIERARIRTSRREAADTFWVTDRAGQPIHDAAQLHELRVATTLLKQFTHLLPHAPDPGQALRQFNAFVKELLSRPQGSAALANLESLDVLETLANLMGVSRFLWEDFLRMQHENVFPVVIDVPGLRETITPATLREDLQRRPGADAGWDDRVLQLNAFKDRALFRIDLRHITGRSTFTQFSAELTDLAEVVVGVAADLVEEALGRRFGRPRLADGRECRWCIAALGKFGGRELGFGSDLELLFVYEDAGATTGPTSLDNADYFERFVQTFLKTVTARQEGVFEIDLRLRPHGRAGALASPLPGFEQYYGAGGDSGQFERLALTKLRAVAGNGDLGNRLEQARDRLVYSVRPLDLANLLHLRGRQAAELVPHGVVNAKYSPGGLVDVEYFVQARQIEAGALGAAVRVTNTLDALQRLAEHGHIPAELGTRLADCYRFLRRLIDALRVVRGHAKDLILPPAGSRGFAYLAHRLQYADAGDLQAAIATWMGVARGLWPASVPPPP
jgi:glutamate-ammonia-ligase adenylyltransferase